MYFFEKNENYKNRVFCIDESGTSYTYSQIWEIGDTLTAKMPPRSLVLLLVVNDVRSVACYLSLLRRRCPGRHLLREEHVGAPGTQKELAAVHPRAGEIADDRPPVGVQPQDDDDAAGLIFAQEGARPSADDHDGNVLPILFHVDAYSVSITVFIDWSDYQLRIVRHSFRI